jgi:ribonuclease Z
MGKIEKIFVTHTHGMSLAQFLFESYACRVGDHIFGLLPLLASRLNGAGGTAGGVEDPRTCMVADQEVYRPLHARNTCLTSTFRPLEIYGPLGTRAYVRNGLKYTHTLLGSPYIVHELRFPSDPPVGDYTSLPLHSSELSTGRNIIQVDGVWRDVYRDNLVSVSAAPILHSVPCVGFVVTEAPIPGKIDPKMYIPDIKRTKTPMSVMSRLQQGHSVELSDGTLLHGPPRRPGRKIVILGDTYDPAPITELAADADILIHEATNAHLPGIDMDTKVEDTFATVEERTKSRGHSTPQMAGAFATSVGARKLVLNHFSARYPGNDDVDEQAKKIMAGIANLAAETFKREVVCARDFMSFDVDVPQ